MDVNGQTFTVDYVPGDSNSGLFGGNSNWRGPIWLCVNFLLIESLLRFHMFYGETLKVECPTGSGEYMHLGHVAEEIQHRLQHLFSRDEQGRRAINGGNDMLDWNPNWREYLWFHEFFHADEGTGLGSSHQTGWTGLIAKMIHDSGLNCRLPHTPRTPSVAAAHYFDDIFSRASKPRPARSRRMSTRSIGNRSDFESVAGDEDEEEAKKRERDDAKVLEWVTYRLGTMNGSGYEEEEEELSVGPAPGAASWRGDKKENGINGESK
jgi:hypothetical protein